MDLIEFLDLSQKRLKKEEGCVLKYYKDTKGYATVGYGHLLLPTDKISNPMTQEEAEELFKQDYAKALKEAQEHPAYSKLDDVRRTVLIDIAFNMGGNWWKGFPACTKALEEGNWQVAADNLKYLDANTKAQETQYFKDVPNRANRNIKLILNGNINDLKQMA